MDKLIEEGDWGHSKYFAYLTSDTNFSRFEPNVSGAVCVCVNPSGHIVLTHHKNGKFDLLGGKLEASETTIDALKREALEEAGYTLTSWELFGYYKVIQVIPNPRYPVEAYILFFIAHGEKTQEITGVEIDSYSEFTTAELKNGKILKHAMLDYALSILE